MFEIIVSICLGVGLAASAGFRIFIPLLLLSVAGYLDYIPLNEGWSWLASPVAMIILAVAALVELVAYYIPYVDNLLDSISVPMAAIAGTAVMVSVVGDLHPAFTWTLAIIAGGGTAAMVSSTTSTARLASTATTGGLGNPVISTVEAGVSTTLSLLSIILPFIAVIFVAFLILGMRKWYRKMFKKNTLSRKR
jgi:hypothetical protein